MPDTTKSLKELLADPPLRIDADDHDPEALLEVYSDTLRLLGAIQIMQTTVDETEQATPDGRLDRLREAWTALRGGDPSTKTERSALAEMGQAAAESEDVLAEQRADLEATLAEHLGADDDLRGFQ